MLQYTTVFASKDVTELIVNFDVFDNDVMGKIESDYGKIGRITTLPTHIDLRRCWFVLCFPHVWSDSKIHAWLTKYDSEKEFKPIEIDEIDEFDDRYQHSKPCMCRGCRLKIMESGE